MLSADANKPGGKSGQRSRKSLPSKKAERSRKPDQQKNEKPDQSKDAGEQIITQIAMTESSAETAPNAAPALEPVEPLPVSQIESSDSSSGDASPIANSRVVPVATAKPLPVSVQVIANAYGDYTKKSLEQAMSFFANLASVRSLDKALELQTEFARQAYESFVAESLKIRELHSELTRQRLMRFEGYVAWMTQTAQIPTRHM